MKKIKAFNVVLTLAAFAALYFLLPNDKEISNVKAEEIEASAPQHPKGITQKAYQQPSVKSIFLHSA